MSSVKQNYHEACETAVNDTLNAQLYASYMFLSMAFHCDRHDVALPGLHKLFKELSDKTREHSEKILSYQNERGGRPKFQSINKPTKDEWSSSSELLENAIMVYKSLNSTYIQLHDTAEKNGDPHLGDFVEDEFLNSTVETIKHLGDLITKRARCGEGLGEYIFDHELSS